MAELLQEHTNINQATVLFYRMVPHYRRALYERLHETIGLHVIAPEQDAGHQDGLSIIESAPWLQRHPFRASLLRHPSAPVGKVLRDLRPETAIVEAGLNNPAMWALLGHRRRHGWPRVMLWGHGWQMGRGFSTPGDWLSQYGRLAPFSLADGYLAYTEDGAGYVRRYLPKLPTFTVGNTLDCKVDEARVATSIAATELFTRPLTVIAVGRMTCDKRMPDLIKMLVLLRRQIPDARLILVGDGPDHTHCQNLAAMLPKNAVQMPGAVYGPNHLAALYAQADIACYAGAVGLAVNEALAHGLPFLALDGGRGKPFHHPEIAYVREGETGLRIPSDGTNGLAALAQAIVSLQENRTRLSDLRRSARRFYLDHLTIDQVADRFAAAVRSVGSLS